MSLFLKDPKTCTNPWRGLAVIVLVCSVVTLVLLIGKRRYKLSLGQHRTNGSWVAAPRGLNKLQTSAFDNRLRF